MLPKQCYVLGCKSKCARHRIPALSSEEWIKRIGRSNDVPKGCLSTDFRNKRICKNHFDPVRVLPSGRLMFGTMPTLNLPAPLSLTACEVPVRRNMPKINTTRGKTLREYIYVMTNSTEEHQYCLKKNSKALNTAKPDFVQKYEHKIVKDWRLDGTPSEAPSKKFTRGAPTSLPSRNDCEVAVVKKRKLDDVPSNNTETYRKKGKTFKINTKKPLPADYIPENIKIRNPISGKTTIYKVVKKVSSTKNQSNLFNKSKVKPTEEVNVDPMGNIKPVVEEMNVDPMVEVKPNVEEINVDPMADKTNVCKVVKNLSSTQNRGNKSNKSQVKPYLEEFNLDPMNFLKTAGPPRYKLFKHHIVTEESDDEPGATAEILAPAKIVKSRDKKRSPEREFKSKYDAFILPMIQKKFNDMEGKPQKVQPMSRLNFSESLIIPKNVSTDKHRDPTNVKLKVSVVNTGNNSSKLVPKGFKKSSKGIQILRSRKGNVHLDTNAVKASSHADIIPQLQLDFQKNTTDTNPQRNPEVREIHGLEKLLIESDIKIDSEEIESSFIYESLSPDHSEFSDPTASDHLPAPHRPSIPDHSPIPDHPTNQDHPISLDCSTTTTPLFSDLLWTKDGKMNMASMKEISGDKYILSASMWNTITLAKEIKDLNILIGWCGDPVAKYLPHFLKMMMNKFSQRIHEFNLNVQVVATSRGRNIINDMQMPVKVVEEEGLQRKRQGAPQCVQLAQWADMLLLLELDAHTLATISQGFCDDLLASVVRSWVMGKPAVYCPCMPSSMWQHPLTNRQLGTLNQWEFVQGPAIIDITLPEQILAKLEETIQFIDSCIIVQY